MGTIELLVDAREFWSRLRDDVVSARKHIYTHALSFEGDSAGQGMAEALLSCPAPDRRVMAIALTTFLVAFVSGFVPFVNAEAYLVSVSVLAPGAAFGAVVAAAAFGQMAAKCLLYLAGRGLLRLPVRGRQIATRRVAALLDNSPGKAAGLVFASALTGLPPFYVVTVAAGALDFPLGRFVVLGGLGRLQRFGAVVLAPRIL